MEPVRILFRARLSSAWITLAAISAEDKIRRGYLRKVAVTYGWRTSSLLDVLPPPLSPFLSFLLPEFAFSLRHFRSLSSCLSLPTETHASPLDPSPRSRYHAVAATRSTCCPSNVPPIGRKLAPMEGSFARRIFPRASIDR